MNALPVRDRSFVPPDLDVLRAEASQVVLSLRNKLELVAELVDTRQRSGIPIIPPDTLDLIAAQDKRDRRAAREAQIAGYPEPIGYSPAPVNLSAVEVHTVASVAIASWVRRIHRLVDAQGLICLWPRPTWSRHDWTATWSTTDLADHLCDLVWALTKTGWLRAMVTDLRVHVDQAERLIEGDDRVRHRDPCPHCGRRSLVWLVDAGVIKCERGRGAPCVCNSPICGCKSGDPRFEHTWIRDVLRERPNSWQSLATLTAAARGAKTAPQAGSTGLSEVPPEGRP